MDSNVTLLKVKPKSSIASKGIQIYNELLKHIKYHNVDMATLDL